MRLDTDSGFVNIRNDTGEQTMADIVPVHVDGSTVLFAGVDADPSALLENSCPSTTPKLIENRTNNHRVFRIRTDGSKINGSKDNIRYHWNNLDMISLTNGLLPN